MQIVAHVLPVRSIADRLFADDSRFEHNEDWWDSDQLFKKPDALFGRRMSYSFTRDSEEVARALICADRSPLRGYALPQNGLPVSEVQFLEVRPDLRRQGIAQRVLTSICQLHPGTVVALSLDDAESFWRQTAWIEVPPDDGDRRSTAFYTVC